MKLKKGEKVPEAKLIMLGKEHKEVNTSEILNSGKVILFGLPGAFTPTCSNKHFPSFLKSKEELKKKYINKVFCISVNDPFVMEAWGKTYNLKDQITLLADVNANLTKCIGAEFNWRGWGLRSKRYTMLIEDGVVKKLVEEEGKCELTAAENFLKDI